MLEPNPETETSVSGSYFHPQLSGRWRKTAGQPGAETARPVVVSVQPRLSISQITTYRRKLHEELSAIADAGFPGIGLWRTKTSEHDDDTVAAMLQEFGIRAASLSWAGGFTGSLKFSYEEALEDARDAVRQAIRLSAETLVILTGSQNGHTVRHCRRTVRDALLLLADEAGDHGLRLALLPMHPRYQQERTFLHGVDDALKLLDELNHPQIGLAFDTFQSWQTPRLLDRIPEFVLRTFLVQLSDSPVDPRDDLDRRLPGQGVLPLPEIVQQFLSYGYQGFFDVQVHSEDVWRLPQSDVFAACRQFVPAASGTVTRFA